MIAVWLAGAGLLLNILPQSFAVLRLVPCWRDCWWRCWRPGAAQLPARSPMIERNFCDPPPGKDHRLRVLEPRLG